MNSYPSYKDSGVEWIGGIPSHWGFSKLKYDTLTPVKYGMNISSDKYVDEGIRFIRITDLTDWGELIKDNGKYLIRDDVTDEFLLDKYDLLFCRSGHTVGKSYLHLEEGDYTSGGYLVRFNFGDYSKSKFIFYVSKTDFYWFWIQLNTVTSTIENVNGEKYSNMIYPKPPNTEQIQIISFLDTKTQKIDELIEKTEQKIKLLKEKRTSLINHCVTKGLNPNVEMKDSGVEWIGEIPSHWGLKKLKYVSEIYSSSVDRHIYKDEIQVSICHYPDVYNNEFIDDEIELNKGSCSEVEFQRYILKKGLVILTKDSETPDDIGNPCYVENDFDNVVCGYHLTIIENNDIDVNSKFLFRFIQSDKVRCHFETESRGITRFSLGKSKIENLFVNLPSYKEQIQIVEYLDEQTQKIDSTIEKETQRIGLLKEYRQSLISEVVTGKIDVRNYNG